MEGKQIIAGADVIENDFHDRKDLTPNICALYVEPERRCRGIAGHLLEHTCKDMATKGITPLDHITEHTSPTANSDCKDNHTKEVQSVTDSFDCSCYGEYRSAEYIKKGITPTADMQNLIKMSDELETQISAAKEEKKNEKAK